jgi:D-sedoheptulose 7-phosphate isomerase
MKDRFFAILDDSRNVQKAALERNHAPAVEAARMIIAVFRSGGRAFFFGNGGSAADSQHIAAEFVGRFQKERRALPAVALTTDTSILTSLANDYSFEVVFSRQLEALGKKGDVAIGFSTSGNSPNILLALRKAGEMGIRTVVFTGHEGGQAARIADVAIVVPSTVTARIQESHIVIAHAICELVENEFLP